MFWTGQRVAIWPTSVSSYLLRMLRDLLDSRVFRGASSICIHIYTYIYLLYMYLERLKFAGLVKRRASSIDFWTPLDQVTHSFFLPAHSRVLIDFVFPHKAESVLTAIDWIMCSFRCSWKKAREMCRWGRPPHPIWRSWTISLLFMVFCCSGFEFNRLEAIWN